MEYTVEQYAKFIEEEGLTAKFEASVKDDTEVEDSNKPQEGELPEEIMAKMKE